MKKKLAWLAAFIIAAIATIFGLSTRDKAEGAGGPLNPCYGVPSIHCTVEPGWLQSELIRLRGVEAFTACVPDPLPEVSYTIGKVKCDEYSTCWVPVYMDTRGLDTWGGLLFIDYDPEVLFADQPPIIEPGPMWDAFYSANAFRQEPGKVNMLILGWHEDTDPVTGERFAYPIGADELDMPLFYFVFTAQAAGKTDVTWRALPDPPPTFFRRFEALVETPDCGLWDVIDWYVGEQETGTASVKPGKVKVEAGKVITSKAALPETWTQIKVLYR